MIRILIVEETGDVGISANEKAGEAEIACGFSRYF